ncbi:MAG: endonuclease [Anaerolineae bacterium]|nr:endonuclease [Anaerolineae bacterium]
MERRTLRAEILEAFEANAKETQARLIQSYESRIQRLKESRAAEIKEARQQSTDQSRAVLKGKLAEQIAPLLPGFDYWPSDARFLGDPIDYVVFDGYTAVKDRNASGDDLEVVILDIKNGRTGLSRGQRRIARAVSEGRVRFEVVRVFEDGTVHSHTWKMRDRE